MKRLLIPVFFGWCMVALAAGPTYSGYRSWIIEHSTTNQIPADERVFVATPPPASPAFVAVIRYREGLSIRSMIDKTHFSGTNAFVRVLRSQRPNIVFQAAVSPNEHPTFTLKPLDVILISDPRIPEN